jgi:hypothetical protein
MSILNANINIKYVILTAPIQEIFSQCKVLRTRLGLGSVEEHLPILSKVLGLIPRPGGKNENTLLDMVVNACNPSTQEDKTGGLCVPGVCRLQSQTLAQRSEKQMIGW